MTSFTAKLLSISYRRKLKCFNHSFISVFGIQLKFLFFSFLKDDKNIKQVTFKVQRKKEKSVGCIQ